MFDCFQSERLCFNVPQCFKRSQNVICLWTDRRHSPSFRHYETYDLTKENEFLYNIKHFFIDRKRNYRVHSTDGTTYSNYGLAIQAKDAVKCPEENECGCSLVIRPVCGIDGKTYGNECVAKKAKTTIECYNRCPCSDNLCMAICPEIEEPFCGYDARTYRQKCLAYCQLFLEIDNSKVLYKHYPGPCKTLEAADGGSEDMTTLSDGKTLITSGLYPDRIPRILLFDFNDPTETVTELMIEGNIPDFRPHGLSVFEVNGSDIVTVMVTNHGIQESVEIYEFRKSTKTMKHKKSVITGTIHLNNVIALSDSTFYAAEDFENFNGGLLLHLELLALTPRGKIWYYDGTEMKQVATGFNMPNGVNLSLDKKYLYLADFVGEKVMTFKINADHSLELVKSLFVDSYCDNIEVDPHTGDLWIGCSPNLYALYDYHIRNNGRSITPSQVLKIKTENGIITSDITEVFLDDGHLISASSVASFYNGKMLIGSIGSELALCEINNK